MDNAQYQTIHIILLKIFDKINNEAIKAKYFNNFCNEIVTNAFNNEYLMMLVCSGLIEDIETVIYENKINVMYDFKIMYNIYNEFKQGIYNTKICSNCNNDILILDSIICNICGYEIGGVSGVDSFYKKKYVSLFNQRIKKHNPNRHCEIWLLQLQGKEIINMPVSDFDKIIQIAKTWQAYNKDIPLSCIIIRKWLKCISLTIYNPHITWIRIQVETICNMKSNSYELTRDEIKEILIYFNDIIEEFPNIIINQQILNVLKKKKIHNILYYPYCIVRILFFVITDKPRLKILLSNIHFQNSLTLFKNDLIWKEICNKLGYTYIPLSIL